MKKSSLLIAGLAIILSFGGCSKRNVNDENNKEPETISSVITAGQIHEDTDVIRVVTEETTYADLASLIESSDLIVEGVFTQDTAQTISIAPNSSAGKPIFASVVSDSKFEIATVIKGDAKEGDVITILQEYAYVEDEDRVITFSGLTPMNKGDRWVYFLKYDPQRHVYYANGDICGRYPSELFTSLASSMGYGVYDVSELNKELVGQVVEYIATQLTVETDGNGVIFIHE